MQHGACGLHGMHGCGARGTPAACRACLQRAECKDRVTVYNARTWQPSSSFPVETADATGRSLPRGRSCMELMHVMGAVAVHWCQVDRSGL